MGCCFMTAQAKQLSSQDRRWEVGDLVMIHGVHLAIVLLYHDEGNVWLVRMMDGTELALWYDDLEPIRIQEKA